MRLNEAVDYVAKTGEECVAYDKNYTIRLYEDENGDIKVAWYEGFLPAFRTDRVRLDNPYLQMLEWNVIDEE